MKKLITVLTLLMCLFGLPASAQEVDAPAEIPDVQPVQVRLEMRVIRLIHESNGALKIETVGNPKITTLDGMAAVTSVESGKEGYTISLTPQVNDDGTIVLTGKMSAALVGSMKATITRVLADGSTTMLLGVTNSANKETQRAVQRGELAVGGTEKHTDYYVQVTVIVNPPINLPMP